MKKLITIIISSIVILILILFAFLGIKDNKSPVVNKEVTQEAISKVISENGLKDWKITMTPKLGASIEYDGKSTIQNLVIKLSTGNTFKVSTLEPNSPITINEKQTIYFGNIDVNLEWINEGKKYSGNIIFQIDSVK